MGELIDFHLNVVMFLMSVSERSTGLSIFADNSAAYLQSRNYSIISCHSLSLIQCKCVTEVKVPS